MLLSLFVGGLIVTATVLTHYEILRLISAALPRLNLPLQMRMPIVVLGCFAGHSIEVWIYAASYFGLATLGYGALEGHTGDGFTDYLYFSVVSYSTLGLGDVYPTGTLRLVSGIEALNGLFLVAWSASFTYLAMEKLWPLHLSRGKSRT